MSDLPTREEAQGILLIKDLMISNNSDAVAIISGYINGDLMSRVEWEATMTEVTNEVWISETFGAYQVIDENGTVVDTVTDLPGRKVYVDAAVKGDTTWHEAGCSLPGNHLADCFVPRRNRDAAVKGET